MARKRRKLNDLTITKRSKTRITQAPKTQDPFNYLNEHCLGFVLDFLDPWDIIFYGAVCVKWKILTHRWISTLGVRLHFPTFWTRECSLGDPDLAIENYKRLARQGHAFKLGYASRARRYPFRRLFQVKKRYTSWAHVFVSDREVISHVSWEKTPGINDATMETNKQLNLDTIFETTSPVEITNISLNEIGLLFLRGIMSSRTSALHDVVYSLTDDYEIWHNLDSQVCTDGSELFPLALGRGQMYYVTMPRTPDADYHLIAFNIHHGVKIYSTVLEPLQFHVSLGNELKIIQIKGKEFIVRLKAVVSLGMPNDGSWITIINATDGQVIQRLPCAPSPSEIFMSDFGKLVLISHTRFVIPEGDGSTPQNREKFITIEEFVHQPDGTFSRESVDAVLHTKHTKIIIDGLTRQVCTLDSMGRVLVHSLKELHGCEVASLLEQMKRLQSGAVEIDSLYTVTEGRLVTFPPKPRAKSRARRTLDFMPLSYDCPTTRFIDVGRIQVRDRFRGQNGAVIIDFNPA